MNYIDIFYIFLLTKISAYCDRINQSIEHERISEECTAIEEIRVNPKRFFNFANKRKKTRSGIASLLTKSNKHTSNNNEIVQLLSDQFKLNFIKPSSANIVSDPNEIFSHYNDSYLCDISFTVEDVQSVFKSFKSYSAPGPDDFPSIVLKECASELAPVFNELFKRSLSSGIVPDSLKIAKITPIHKSGAKQNAGNYRPDISYSESFRKNCKEITSPLS